MIVFNIFKITKKLIILHLLRIQILHTHIHILFQMVDDKYIPYTQFDHGILSRLSFKLKNEEDDEKAVIYTIEYTDSSMVENEIMPIESSNIKNYDKADRYIYEWLLNRNNIIQRNDYIRSIEKNISNSSVRWIF